MQSMAGLTDSLLIARERVHAHRERQRASGRVSVSVFLPGDLIESVDRIKEERGVSARAAIIEEALRVYIEKQRA
jgi:hypothetical protein